MLESNSINCLKCENTSYDQDYINSRNNYLKELEVVYENLFGRGHKDDRIGFIIDNECMILTDISEFCAFVLSRPTFDRQKILDQSYIDKITKEEDAILNPFLKRYQEMIHVRNNKIFWLINQYNCGIDESIYAYYIDLFDMEQEFFFGLYSGDAGLLYFKLASYYSHISLEKATSFLYKSRKCFGFLPKTYQIHEKIDYYLNMLK
ncbi:hypothetical protein A3Q56_01382 [Intoshia linei]|uniref:Uncharacterized protein n=1 Tax=Intoshia linei TaxID=1819745 RepID=A0A177B9G4_9BILA|nr:hypothetical protein A3Q56_01382 [Intoshia linei]